MSPQPNDVPEPITIGGQAVIEGVMMRGPSAWAVAVRRPDGELEARRHLLPRLSTRSRWAKVPFVRGVLVLAESLTLGFRALSWSAQMAVGDDEEPLTGRQVAGSMTIALLVFLAIFVLVPAAAARAVAPDGGFLFGALEGIVRLLLFVGYIWAIGRSKEIQRVFRFHGAEHMTIHAYEAGEPLSVESVARYRPEHPRCGTSFLLIVVIASIVAFSFLGDLGWIGLIVSRIVLIPVIAGAAYEVLRFSGLHRSDWLGSVLAAPGLWLQRLTTGEPAEDQIEVAITSMLSALDAEAVSEVTGRGQVPAAALAARAT